MSESYKKLITGYRKFKESHLKGADSPALDIKQNPNALVISCCDSRVVPNFILGAAAGEIFSVRNIANLVPPYDERHSSYHGTSAALEYAVKFLKVENIIILGHTKCGGVEALVNGGIKNGTDFVGKWMEIAKPALLEALKHQNNDFAATCACCEKESLKVSLANLKTFPFIQQAVNDGRLQLHAMLFDISACVLSRYNEETALFEEII